MNLTEFLEARISEDEAVAQEAIDAGRLFGREGTDDTVVSAVFESLGPYVGVGIGRMLAECAAKRTILEAHRTVDHEVHRFGLHTAASRAAAINTRTGLNVALQALAAAYADHPDYDPAWQGTDDTNGELTV